MHMYFGMTPPETMTFFKLCSAVLKGIIFNNLIIVNHYYQYQVSKYMNYCIIVLMV